MRILALHTGHNAAVAAFDDYTLLAAVEMERLTRKKGDGGRIPFETMDEVLAIAGWNRSEVEVFCATRKGFPPTVFKSLPPLRRAMGSLRALIGQPPKQG